MSESRNPRTETDLGIAILRAAQKALEAAVMEIRHLEPRCNASEMRFLAARALSVAFSALVQRCDEETFR